MRESALGLLQLGRCEEGGHAGRVHPSSRVLANKRLRSRRGRTDGEQRCSACSWRLSNELNSKADLAAVPPSEPVVDLRSRAPER